MSGQGTFKTHLSNSRRNIETRIRAHVARIVAILLLLFPNRRPILNNARVHRVLFWVPGGYRGLLNIEGPLGLALEMRGCRVHFVICDGSYTACAQRFYQTEIPMERWDELCGSCRSQNAEFLRLLGLQYSYVGDYVLPREKLHLRESSSHITKDRLAALSLNGIDLGKNLTSALVRQTRGAGLENQEMMIREFAYTVLMVAQSSSRVLDQFKPDRVFMSHGVYADWGPALQVCLSRGIPVIGYESSYLENHFYFGKVDAELSAFRYMSSDGWNACSSRSLIPEQEDQLFSFVKSRYVGDEAYDLSDVLKPYIGETAEIRKKLRLNKDLPVWGIMTHVTWDNSADKYPMVFNSFDHWLSTTLDAIAEIKNVQWVIKIHPSEKRENPQTGAQALVQRRFSELPSHIRLVRMDDDINPADFYQIVDGCVSVFGTVGLELALVGKPTILAGTPHYARRGFTYDAMDRAHYLQLLNIAASLERLNKEQTSLAMRYGYCFFILRQIPLPFVRRNFQFRKELMWTLIPTKNRIVDFLCQRILDGHDFILDTPVREEGVSVTDRLDEAGLRY